MTWLEIVGGVLVVFGCWGILGWLTGAYLSWRFK